MNNISRPMNTLSRNVGANERGIYSQGHVRGEISLGIGSMGPRTYPLCQSPCVMHFSCDYMDSTHKSDWQHFFPSSCVKSPKLPYALQAICSNSLFSSPSLSLSIIMSSFLSLYFHSFHAFLFFFITFCCPLSPLVLAFVSASEKDLAKQAKSLSAAAGKLLQKHQ